MTQAGFIVSKSENQDTNSTASKSVNPPGKLLPQASMLAFRKFDKSTGGPEVQSLTDHGSMFLILRRLYHFLAFPSLRIAFTLVSTALLVTAVVIMILFTYFSGQR
jgi:hypothetical protein